MALRVIVALEVEDPEGIKMWVNCHVQGIRTLPLGILLTILIHGLAETNITLGVHTSEKK